MPIEVLGLHRDAASVDERAKEILCLPHMDVEGCFYFGIRSLFLTVFTMPHYRIITGGVVIGSGILYCVEKFDMEHKVHLVPVEGIRLLILQVHSNYDTQSTLFSVKLARGFRCNGLITDATFTFAASGTGGFEETRTRNCHEHGKISEASDEV